MKIAMDPLLKDPSLKHNFHLFLQEFQQNNLVPPMSQAHAIKALGNLTQEEILVTQYQEKFNLLAQRAGLESQKCTKLFFIDLKPEPLSVLTVRGIKPELQATCEDLKDLENLTLAQNKF